jgi:DnaK suppressor protein
MKTMQINSFKQQLLDLRSELSDLSSTSADAAKPVELDQAAIGRLTRMDAMRAQSMAIETKARREHQLLRIEGALQRITTGDYGLCLTCGEEINTRRLEVDPSYTQCIKCADK